MVLLIKNIKQLFYCSNKPVPLLKGQAMSFPPNIEHAYLKIQDGKIHSIGRMKDIDSSTLAVDIEIDSTDKFVFPTYVDCHTHLVFAAWRESEYMDRVNGLSYEEISKRGGGILNSAIKIKNTSEDELFEISLERLNKVIKTGTGAIEIKSGYGLSTESELKMLKVIQRLKEENLIPIRSTFLGAHSYPLEFREDHNAYIKILIDEMLPEIAKHKLADYCDVFCEKNFFSVGESERILSAAQKLGMPSRIHSNQFTHTGAISMAKKINALSVDHLEVLNDDEIQELKDSTIIPCFLPGAAFVMNCEYPPARKLIDQNIPFTIASDFNPGTCPISDMRFIQALSVNKMKINTLEAFSAMTVNASHSLQLENTVGSFFPGAKANFILSKKIPSINFIPYSFSGDWLESIFIDGSQI